MYPINAEVCAIYYPIENLSSPTINHPNQIRPNNKKPAANERNNRPTRHANSLQRACLSVYLHMEIGKQCRCAVLYVLFVWTLHTFLLHIFILFLFFHTFSLHSLVLIDSFIMHGCKNKIIKKQTRNSHISKDKLLMMNVCACIGDLNREFQMLERSC